MADEHTEDQPVEDPHVEFLRKLGHDQAANLLATLGRIEKSRNPPAENPVSPADREREVARELLEQINRLPSRNRRSVGF